MQLTLTKGLHVLALGLWFGGAAFFNLVAAPSIFASFDSVVATAPSDRTAFISIVPQETSPVDRKNLSSALAGAAVGPVFPKYFAMQAICATLALFAATTWWNAADGSSIHRWRVIILALAALTVAVGWAISAHVSELRLLRFDPNPDIAANAKAAFADWHVVSLMLSLATIVLSGSGLALAAKLPAR